MTHNGTQYLCAGVVYGVERAAALLGSVGEQEEVSEDGLAAGAIRKEEEPRTAGPGDSDGVWRLGHVACSYGPAAPGFLMYKT